MILFIIWWFKVSGNALIFISTKLFSFCHLEIRHSILNSFSYNISVFVPIVNVSHCIFLFPCCSAKTQLWQKYILFVPIVNVSQNLTWYCIFIPVLQCKHKVMIFFKFLYCCFSGMLTGKFKKDVVPDAGSSRAGYLASLKREGKSNMSYYEGIANEDRFWKLLDVIEDTAKIHGRYASQSINNDQSTNLVCSHNALRSMV